MVCEESVANTLQPEGVWDVDKAESEKSVGRRGITLSWRHQKHADYARAAAAFNGESYRHHWDEEEDSKDDS